MSDKTHTNGCDGKEVYTDHDWYGMTWTCYCGAVAMNTIVGANFKHRDAKTNTQEPKP